MESRSTGFTLVELLMVIVVIAVLAGITVVGFSGVRDRADLTKKRSDLASIKTALELYKTDNGRYPNSEACVNIDSNYNFGWCGFNQGSGDSFIPGLSPTYMRTIPNLDPSLLTNDSFLYRASGVASGGVDGGGVFYQLIRYRAAGLPASELPNNPLLWTGDYNGIAWGYKSDTSLPNW